MPYETTKKIQNIRINETAMFFLKTWMIFRMSLQLSLKDLIVSTPCWYHFHTNTLWLLLLSLAALFSISLPYEILQCLVLNQHWCWSKNFLHHGGHNRAAKVLGLFCDRSPKFRPKFSERYWNVLQCKQCGLLYLVFVLFTDHCIEITNSMALKM